MTFNQFYLAAGYTEFGIINRVYIRTPSNPKTRNWKERACRSTQDFFPLSQCAHIGRMALMLALLHGKFPHEILYRDFFRAAGGAGSALDAILRSGKLAQRFFFLMLPVCSDNCGNVDACRTRRFASSAVCAGSFYPWSRMDRIQNLIHFLKILVSAVSAFSILWKGWRRYRQKGTSWRHSPP